MPNYSFTTAVIADRYGLDPDILRRIEHTESGGNPNAVSPKGAIGVMQLMPGTAKELGVDPRDPISNIDGGARYFKQQLDRFGSPEQALAAYNAGPGRVSRGGPLPAETQAYVQKIMGGVRNTPHTSDTPFGDAVHKTFTEAAMADQAPVHEKDTLDKALDWLPTAGGIVGGLGGAALGGIPTLGGGAVVGGVAGAAAGGAAGEGIRQFLEKMVRGHNDQSDLIDIPIEGAKQGAYELAGAGIGKAAGAVLGGVYRSALNKPATKALFELNQNKGLGLTAPQIVGDSARFGNAAQRIADSSLIGSGIAATAAKKTGEKIGETGRTFGAALKDAVQDANSTVFKPRANDLYDQIDSRFGQKTVDLSQVAKFAQDLQAKGLDIPILREIPSVPVMGQQTVMQPSKVLGPNGKPFMTAVQQTVQTGKKFQSTVEQARILRSQLLEQLGYVPPQFRGMAKGARKEASNLLRQSVGDAAEKAGPGWGRDLVNNADAYYSEGSEFFSRNPVIKRLMKMEPERIPQFMNPTKYPSRVQQVENLAQFLGPHGNVSGLNTGLEQLKTLQSAIEAAKGQGGIGASFASKVATPIEAGAAIFNPSMWPWLLGYEGATGTAATALRSPGTVNRLFKGMNLPVSDRVLTPASAALLRVLGGSVE